MRATPAAFWRIPYGHPERRSLLLEKGQLRDAVKSSGTQSTHISMIHRRSLPSGALSQCVCTKVAIGLWICGRVRIPADRPERRRVDNPWTAPKGSRQTTGVSTARPTGCPHSRASRPHTHRLNNKLFLKEGRRGVLRNSVPQLTGQNISARIIHKQGRSSFNPLIKRVFRQERFGRS